MKLNMKIIYALAIIAVMLTGAGFYWRSADPCVVYIDNNKLFDGFVLKQSLEKELKHAEEKGKYTIDSLKLAYESWNKQLDSIQPKEKDQAALLIKTRQFENYIRSKEQEILQKNEAEAQAASDQVWKQLNQYVADFGQEQGYDIVFGVSGNGNIMYGKKEMDKTVEVIAYANKKYQGKK